MIGTFGAVVFETSSRKIHTFDDFERQGAAAFAEHAVIDGKPRLEFTGENLDEISFSIRLDAHLGVDPAGQVKQIRAIKAAGRAQTLIIGGVPLGNFVITSLAEKWQRIDNKGRLILAHNRIKRHGPVFSR